MGISDRLMGKKNVNGRPHIDGVSPNAALPGAEIRISGSGLRPVELRRPRVQFGEVEGTVYRVAPNGTMSAYAEGMGIATGIAFDREQNLYVGDRSGTVFKIARDRQTFVFATLEPSVSAYHLAFGPKGDLFITGPTTSSFDAVYRIDMHGTVSNFFRGVGRPQGL